MTAKGTKTIKYNKEYLMKVLERHEYFCKIWTPEWANFALQLIQTELLESK